MRTRRALPQLRVLEQRRLQGGLPCIGAKLPDAELEKFSHADQFLVQLHKIPGYHILLECIYAQVRAREMTESESESTES